MLERFGAEDDVERGGGPRQRAREIVGDQPNRPRVARGRCQTGRGEVHAGHLAIEAGRHGTQQLAAAAPDVEDSPAREIAGEGEDAGHELGTDAGHPGESLVAGSDVPVGEVVASLQHARAPVDSARPTIRPSR